MNVLLAVFYILGFTCFATGLQTLLYYPLSLLFILRGKKKPFLDNPLVSIVVPAHNEKKVIGRCVESILASDYPRREIILVDDGSTDGTLDVMRRYEPHPHVTVVAKPNAGKASALNAGLAWARGEIVFFIDSDTLFHKDTIRHMLSAFDSPQVGAVCGHDSPLSQEGLYLKLATLQAHVSTGFVRRALSVINCLPIVSGNIGAFRRDVLEKTGPFLESFISEDLEMTFRVHKASYRVRFEPWSRVLAECPTTIKGLWKQRVRWTRGFIQTVEMHRDMLFNPRYGRFGLYLGLNAINMLVIPVFQFASLLLLPPLIFSGHNPFPLQLLSIMGWLGLGFALLATVYGIILDRDWEDLKYLYAVPLWVPFSLFIDLVIVWSIILELRGAGAEWHKVARRGLR